MPDFVVRFRGNFMDAHGTRLADAGITHEGSGSGFEEGVLYSGQSFHAVRVEADDEAAAVKAVRDALGPDAGTFEDWRAEPVPNAETGPDP